MIKTNKERYTFKKGILLGILGGIAGDIISHYIVVYPENWNNPVYIIYFSISILFIYLLIHELYKN